MGSPDQAVAQLPRGGNADEGGGGGGGGGGVAAPKASRQSSAPAAELPSLSLVASASRPAAAQWIPAVPYTVQCILDL